MLHMKFSANRTRLLQPHGLQERSIVHVIGPRRRIDLICPRSYGGPILPLFHRRTTLVRPLRAAGFPETTDDAVKKADNSFMRSLWTAIDIIAIFGWVRFMHSSVMPCKPCHPHALNLVFHVRSIAGALLALLGIGVAHYVLMLPMILPVVSLVAALNREGLIVQVGDIPPASLTASKDTTDNRPYCLYDAGQLKAVRQAQLSAAGQLQGFGFGCTCGTRGYPRGIMNGRRWSRAVGIDAYGTDMEPIHRLDTRRNAPPLALMPPSPNADFSPPPPRAFRSVVSSRPRRRPWGG